MEISKEVGEKIANAKMPRATRKVAVILSQLEKDTDIVLDLLAPFAEFEKALYDKWFLKMSRDINDLRVDPETYAYQLVLKIRNEKDVNLDKVVALAERRNYLQQSKGHRPSRILGQVMDYVKNYLRKYDEFYRYAVEYIKNFDMEGLKNKVAEEEDKTRRADEDRLFQLQVLKHLRNLQEYEKPIPLELLKIALDTEFSNNQKILQEQSLVVYHIYDSKLDKPLLVKQMCFDFIREVLTSITGNVTLINWLFLDDWVSKETYDLLTDAYPVLKKLGMGSVVFFKVRRLHEKWHLERRTDEELTTPERFVVDLLNLYSDEKVNVLKD
ncbi:MAG: hypothetical protein IJZ59_02580 [Alphaproteobacteria bacterium]|nr:hypothetical protein [Alphaproteobacteria bacterium]